MRRRPIAAPSPWIVSTCSRTVPSGRLRNGTGAFIRPFAMPSRSPLRAPGTRFTVPFWYPAANSLRVTSCCVHRELADHHLGRVVKDHGEVPPFHPRANGVPPVLVEISGEHGRERNVSGVLIAHGPLSVTHRASVIFAAARSPVPRLARHVCRVR